MTIGQIDTSLITDIGKQSANPFENFLQGQETAKQISRRDEAFDLNRESQELGLESQKLKNISQAEMQSFDSVAKGALMLKNIVGDDDFQTASSSGKLDQALDFLETRQGNLQRQQAEGLPVNTEETDRALMLLSRAKQGDEQAYNQLMSSSGRIIDSAKLMGVFKKPSFANMPTADIKNQRELQKLLDQGDMLGASLLARKAGLIGSGQQFNADGQVVNIEGFTQALQGQEFSKTFGKGLGEQATKPETERLVEEGKIPAKQKIEEIKTQEKKIQSFDKEITNIQTDLSNFEANYPSMVENLNRAKELSNKVAFGAIEEGGNLLAGLAGVETESMKAEAEYNSILKNQVLPLLKPTFGGNVSDSERQSLLATIEGEGGPETKQKTIDAFIRQKSADINAKREQLKNLQQRKEQFINPNAPQQADQNIEALLNKYAPQ